METRCGLSLSNFDVYLNIAGGFKITYPNYDWYETDYLMTKRIEEQNNLIRTFSIF